MLSKKKKTIIGVICFILIVYFVLFAIGTLLTPKNKQDYATYRSTNLRYVFNEEENSLDVLVFGHSGVMYGYSPMEVYEEYGITSYNCSRTTQSPAEARALLTELLKTQSPKVVIINADEFFYDKPENIIKFAALQSLDTLFPIFRVHSNWRNAFYKKDTKKRSFLKSYNFDKNVKPYTGKDKMIETSKKHKMFSMHKRNLDKIVNICKENEIELVIMELPSVVLWDTSRHNTMIEYTEKNNIPFIDFNDKSNPANIDLTKDSCDKGDHLNIYGARKIAKYLGQYLQDNYNLENHRLNEDYKLTTNYKNWEEDLVLYKKFCEEKLSN